MFIIKFVGFFFQIFMLPPVYKTKKNPDGYTCRKLKLNGFRIYFFKCYVLSEKVSINAHINTQTN